MDEYLGFAKDLARKAGAIIKDNFDANLSIELKPDYSPVTDVDREINELVIRSIHEAYPAHGVLGEEGSKGTGNEELQWICDPLDGTAAFIVGIKHNSFVLGLSQQGQVLLSVVYDPFGDNLYHAVKEGGAFCNDEPIHVNAAGLQGGYVIVEETGYKLYEPLWKAGAILVPAPGAAYRAMLLARGRLSAIVQAKADNHDIGPASLIVEEAGGKVTLFDGTAPRYDQPISSGLVLSNGTCHVELLSAINL